MSSRSSFFTFTLRLISCNGSVLICSKVHLSFALLSNLIKTDCLSLYQGCTYLEIFFFMPSCTIINTIFIKLAIGNVLARNCNLRKTNTGLLCRGWGKFNESFSRSHTYASNGCCIFVKSMTKLAQIISFSNSQKDHDFIR